MQTTEVLNTPNKDKWLDEAIEQLPPSERLERKLVRYECHCDNAVCYDLLCEGFVQELMDVEGPVVMAEIIRKLPSDAEFIDVFEAVENARSERGLTDSDALVSDVGQRFKTRWADVDAPYDEHNPESVMAANMRSRNYDVLRMGTLEALMVGYDEDADDWQDPFDQVPALFLPRDFVADMNKYDNDLALACAGNLQHAFDMSQEIYDLINEVEASLDQTLADARFEHIQHLSEYLGIDGNMHFDNDGNLHVSSEGFDVISKHVFMSDNGLRPAFDRLNAISSYVGQEKHKIEVARLKHAELVRRSFKLFTKYQTV
jgi:hypothetical protein